MVNAHGGHTRYWLVTPQLMPDILLGTMRIHSTASGEEMCKNILSQMIPVVYSCIKKNKHTDT